MGGWGSGRYGYRTARTTEATNRVDIRYIRKQGWLYDGRAGLLSWTCRGEPSGNVTYRIEGDTFTLDYRVKEPGEEWESVKLPVSLTTTHCRFGGKRYYFLCPNVRCQRRCEVLYSDSLYFVCRKCAGLIYDSQKGGEIDKLINAKHRLGERIFEDYDGDGWRKKSGMHWRVFGPLQEKYWELERSIDDAIAARLMA